jgi:hypothetical protein
MRGLKKSGLLADYGFTAAAKAEELITLGRRHKCLLHPVGTLIVCEVKRQAADERADLFKDVPDPASSFVVTGGSR